VGSHPGIALVFMPIQKLRARRADKESEEEESRFRQALIKEKAEALIETIDKGDSNPAQRQKMIDELDDLNDCYDA
jgi:hypothetical protein